MSEHEAITKARLALANARAKLQHADAEHKEASRLWTEMSERVLQSHPKPANRGSTILPPQGEKDEARKRVRLAGNALKVAQAEELAASDALDDALRAHHPDLALAREAFKSAREEGCPLDFDLRIEYSNLLGFCMMCQKFYSIDDMERCVSCEGVYGCPVCCLDFAVPGDLRPGQNKCTNCIHPVLGSKWPITGRSINPATVFMLARELIASRGGKSVRDECFKFEEKYPQFAALSRMFNFWELRGTENPEKKQRKE